MRHLSGIVLNLAEGAIKGAASGVIKSASGGIVTETFLGEDGTPKPPAPPPSPSSPMIAPLDVRQPDAFVFLGLCLSVAIPAGMIMRSFEEAAEESDWSEVFSYERLPVWLLASYAFSASAFGELFVHGASSSALQSTHYALSSCAMLCAIRHMHKAGGVSRRSSGAIMMSFLIAFSVVLFFRTSMHTERCTSTMFILTIFCAAPCWRVYSARTRMAGDIGAEKARYRGRVAHFVLVVGIGLQPWLGVCMTPTSWAEGVQMAGELAVLALATESLWA